MHSIPLYELSPEAAYSIQILKNANIKDLILDLIFKCGFKYNLHFIAFLCVNGGWYT